MNPAEPRPAKLPTPDRSRFSCPREVVESQSLSPEQKRDILLQWLEDEKALCVADDEGMHGDRPSQIDALYRALRTLPK